MTITDSVRAALSDRYRIESQLGSGGMATVYLARDLKHDREVAVKVLRADLSAVIGAERFLAEVRIAAKLDHPHILTLIDSGEADGILYYVLPYVRGESLRARLLREKQLGLDEALSITKQVASALDYAHRQGVVHRDIKPENILLHEGEAVLADFGIALAVKEAGGNRLTETGLSLGTPQYMSPEQATGDRSLDARSDVYSLAAVLYEMIAGEPPVTGATAQVVIAKLLTERPTRLRVVRDTVPDGVERAVEKALAKVPADRFTSAGDFSRALEAAMAPIAARAGGPRIGTALMVTAGAIVVLVLGVWLARGRGRASAPSAVLRDRTQITFTGRVRYPAISNDGKTLAYVSTNCRATGCTYGIELQDVGGSATKRLFDGATAVYRIEWSPDRRNVLFEGTINASFGEYLISTLGGTPRQITPNVAASFWAGGDSLLWTRLSATSPAPAYWVMVSGLDGVPRDSIRVAEAGDALNFVEQVPGSRWIIAVVAQKQRLGWRAVDRSGRSGGELHTGPANNPVRVSSDAVWIWSVPPTGGAQPIERVPFDATTGRFANRSDTLYKGTPTAFDVTADGASLVVDEGTTEYNAWAVNFGDAVRGVLPDQKRLIHATAPLSLQVSPDGNRLLVGRDVGSSAGGARRFSVMPFAGGAETPLPFAAQPLAANWMDSATIEFSEQAGTGTRLGLMDARTGSQRALVALPDSAPLDWEPLPAGGWAWVPNDGHSIVTQGPSDGKPRRFAMPSWYLQILHVNAARDGRRVAFIGWNKATYDSLGLSVMSLADGNTTQWAAKFGEGAVGQWLADGSFFFAVLETLETYTLYRVRGPGQIERLGTIPRPLAGISLSADLKRAAAVERDYHGDVWMSRVVRP